MGSLPGRSARGPGFLIVSACESSLHTQHGVFVDLIAIQAVHTDIELSRA
jgi:hypothetical protein